MNKGTPHKPSPRLLAVAERVRHRTLADVCADHAYLPVYLAGQGRLDAAAATDINPGPLARAAAHVAERGLCGVISVRMGDGLAPVGRGEFETLVIAGVGGRLIIDILAAKLDTALSFKQLLLSPQRDAAALRRWLHGNGFMITGEAALFDGGVFYVILDCEPGCEPAWDDLGYAFGKRLPEGHDAALAEHLERESVRVQGILSKPNVTDSAKLREYAELIARARERSL